MCIGTTRGKRYHETWCICLGLGNLIKLFIEVLEKHGVQAKFSNLEGKLYTFREAIQNPYVFTSDPSLCNEVCIEVELQERVSSLMTEILKRSVYMKLKKNYLTAVLKVPIKTSTVYKLGGRIVKPIKVPPRV